MNGAVKKMQSTTDPCEADHIRLALETKYAPNQVLQRGAEAVVTELVAGLAVSTELGQNETWELLAQLAVGAVPPTAALLDVVEATQNAILSVVPAAISRVTDVVSRDYDFLAVDVLDAAMEYLPREVQTEVAGALHKFALRGEREARRVRVIAEHPDTP